MESASSSSKPHRGPAALLGQVRPVEEQLGLQALSLDRLWVLETFTEFVLVPGPGDGGQPAPVRIPLLGFPKRSPALG